MKITPSLLSWQRRLYGDGHRHPLNLAIHLLTAPIFMGSVVGLFVAPLWGMLGLVAAIGLQGFGHSREAARPEPFLSPLDFVARFFAENFVTFWRYLFSGELFRNWGAKRDA